MTLLYRQPQLILSQRTSIGNAKGASMTDDLNMDSDQYPISYTVVFITYVVFDVP